MAGDIGHASHSTPCLGTTWWEPFTLKIATCPTGWDALTPAWRRSTFTSLAGSGYIRFSFGTEILVYAGIHYRHAVDDCQRNCLSVLRGSTTVESPLQSQPSFQGRRMTRRRVFFFSMAKATSRPRDQLACRLADFLHVIKRTLIYCRYWDRGHEGGVYSRGSETSVVRLSWSHKFTFGFSLQICAVSQG